jgi:hypothetical protein
MYARRAGLQCGSAFLGLQHRMAMGHRVVGGIGKLVLHTLCPAYCGCGLRQEQQEQQHGQTELHGYGATRWREEVQDRFSIRRSCLASPVQYTEWLRAADGASPRLFRPRYALANLGHPSLPVLTRPATLGPPLLWNPTSREKRARCPNFLLEAPTIAACGAFFTERPMEFAGSNQPHRKIRGCGPPVSGF